MSNYSYIKTDKTQGTVTANDADSALKSAEGIDPKSGVQLMPDTSVNSDNLQNNPPIVPVVPTPPTEMTGLGGALESNTAYTDNLIKESNTAKQKADVSFEDYLKEALGGSGKTSLENKYYHESVDPAKAELRDINQQITAEQVGLRRRVEKLQKNPQGLFGGGLEQEVNRVTNESIAKQADLAVIQMAKQGKYDSAKEIADRAVSARLETEGRKLEAMRLTYEKNKDSFTTAEQRAFETQQSDRERVLDKQKEDLTTISDLSIKALENGAPTTVAAQMRQAKTVEEAIKIGGQYTRDTLRQLQIQKAQLEVDNLKNPSGPTLPQDYSSFLSSRTPEQITAFNGLPDADKSVVSQLVNGDALLTDLVKTRGAQGTKDIQKYIQEATSIDPTFSVNTNKLRYAFLQQWNNPNGKQGTTRNAINTALGHLADFKISADALDAGAIKKLNSVANVLSTETGDPKVLQLRTDINALASELATVYKGSAPTEKEIEDWSNTIAANFSKAQFQGVSNEISKLLTSKITASRYQYKSTMGFEYGQSIIDPDKRQALVDAGIDPTVIASEKIPVTGSIKDRAAAAGYDYDAMVRSGYKENEIEDALKKAGY